jgi:hypothetical protein
VKTVTLDTNCLYELEAEESPKALERIVAMSHEGKLVLQIPAIIASERQRNGSNLDDFDCFRDRVSRMDLGSISLLKPLAYIGLSYIGWALIIGPVLEREERQIHNILFPNLPFDAEDIGREDVQARRRWRNAKCDVQMMWCHLHYGGDCFVTRDSNFLKRSKKTKLESLGAGLIAEPEEAVRILEL